MRKIPNTEIDAFMEEHGGVEVYGAGPDGPVYRLADGWSLWIRPDGVGIAGETGER